MENFVSENYVKAQPLIVLCFHESDLALGENKLAFQLWDLAGLSTNQAVLNSSLAGLRSVSAGLPDELAGLKSKKAGL